MEFFTVSHEKRPVRLTEATRQFAWESLHHKYGQDTRLTPAVSMDDIPGFGEMSPIRRYDEAIARIARDCRIRICDNEKLSGAATLGAAIGHSIPAAYEGQPVFPSISHLTIDFRTVVDCGVDSLEQQVMAKQQETDLTDRQYEYLQSCRNTLNALRLWHSRYLDALKDKPGYAANYRNLLNVPFRPASSFHEAVQSIWFVFAFCRLCGNWPGIGRIDQILGRFLQRDLNNRIITLDEAREILAHFFIKGCEWITGEECGSGDAQHYQNLVIAGVDEQGNEVTNEVTYLILDILEELNIGDFPTTVRLNRSSEDKLLRRVAETMKHGGGALAVYNEEKIIQAMTTHGYALSDARSFANDGCWEVQVPGRTHFCYIPFDGLRILLSDTLHLDGEPAHFDSIESLKQAYFRALDDTVTGIVNDTLRGRTTQDGEDWRWSRQIPCTVVSLFEGGCIRNAASYLEGGADFIVVSPHIGGASDIGNSLLAIDKLCFRDKTVSFDRLMEILKNNWEGEEALRQYVLNKFTYYGNDDDAADAYTVEVADTFAKLVLTHDGRCGIRFVAGISTFGRQIEWRYDRPASPHGHRTGDVLAPNMSATPGSDLAGATAIVRSYCKLNLTDQVTGAALDLKLLPGSVKGEDGTAALMGLMRGFVLLGGCFMQPDVVDNTVLLKAQAHPEDYQSLSVRISGWNARFVTLNKEWQDMCIQKSGHGTV